MRRYTAVERAVFEEKYRAASTVRNPLFDQVVKEYSKFDKEINFVICVEELAELLQVISKFYRQKGDRLNLIEELGDSVICIETMKQIFDITQEELDAESIKRQQIQDCTKKESSVLYVTEVADVMHEISLWCVKTPERYEALQTLSKMSDCIKGIHRFFSITEEEINKEINVKIDRDVRRLAMS